MISDPVRLAAIGLGRGFALSARALHAHPGIKLIAAANPSPAPRKAFEATFGGTSYCDHHDMLKDSAIEIVYVATPHQLHAEHVTDCLNAGKHVVVEKPLAIDLYDAACMVTLATEKGLHLLVGPSHSYDAPVARAAQEVSSGNLGLPRVLNLLTATDFVYRPRRREELDTGQGGGVVFSQAIHQIDIAMRLLDATPVSVYAKTGSWDLTWPTEGAFTTIVSFDNGAHATLTYSGYGYFNSDTLLNDISELGVKKTTGNTAVVRRERTSEDDQTAGKKTRTFSGLDGLPNPEHHEQFGQAVLFCEHGDIQLMSDSIRVHRGDGIDEIHCPFSYSRASFAEAINSALRHRSPPLQNGAWGFTALATCHAMLQSARSGQPINIKTIQEAQHG